MSPPKENPLISPLDAADLEAKGLLLKGSTPGFHKIHLRRLHRWSDEEYQHLPLAPQPLDPRAFVEIPTSLISYETALHVGYSPKKANELWNYWSNWEPGMAREVDPDDGGLIMEYIEILVARVEERDSVPQENLDDLDWWFKKMYDLGINPESRSAILDPQFEYLRCSVSVHQLLEGMIRMRYNALYLVRDASRLREKELKRRAAESEEEEESGGLKICPVISSPSPPLWDSSAMAEASKEPGYTVLYQATDLRSVARLQSSHYDLEVQGEEGEFRHLGMMKPFDKTSDFLRGTCSTFTPDPRMAEHQAAYLKLLVGIHSVVIVAIRLPNSAIESLSRRGEVHQVHWPSDAWKKLVWSTAYPRNYRDLPCDLKSIMRATLVIGSISRKERLRHVKLDSWEDMTEDFVFKMGADGRPGGTGEISTQYVFDIGHGWDWLEENCGKGDAKIFTGVEGVDIEVYVFGGMRES
ncbi:hypothetical protein V8F20_010853 [Naviculisporaceae sp. PSN 640]